MNINEVFGKFFGPASRTSTIAEAFRAMGIAEEELRLAGEDMIRPGAGSCFMASMIPPVLRGYTPALYRHHCREIIARAQAGEDLEPATVAEVLAHLSAMSLKAPPGDVSAALQDKLFRDVFGPDVLLPLDDQPIREPWAGSNDEHLAVLRRKFRTPGRGLNESSSNARPPPAVR